MSPSLRETASQRRADGRSVAGKSPPFSLRPFTPADLDALLVIEQACFGAERFHRRQLRYLLSRPTVIGQVAEVGGRIVAYMLLLLRKATRNVRLYTLAVLPEMRGHGIARALIASAEATAHEHGKTRLTLEFRRENTAAKGLYASLGFMAPQPLPGYYPDGDGLRLTKNIS